MTRITLALLVVVLTAGCAPSVVPSPPVMAPVLAGVSPTTESLRPEANGPDAPQGAPPTEPPQPDGVQASPTATPAFSAPPSPTLAQSTPTVSSTPAEPPPPTGVTPPGTPADPATCLLGGWRVENLLELAQVALGAVGADPQELIVSGGGLELHFDRGGQASFDYDATAFSGVVALGGSQLPLQVEVNGHGAAGYSVAGNAISFSAPDLAGVSVEASIGGHPSPVSVPPEQFDIFEATALTFDCAGSRAEMSAPSLASGALRLSRLAP